jgi:hypothetical protein
MPTPTDLVTDLPADFEVFGQAVDTSMADLKGGTTGQILSKATNTDMDFTWITNDVGDITAVTVTAPITGGGTSGSGGIGSSGATTSAAGAVQLSDSTSTTSSVLASTPTATKAAYDLANAAIAKSTVTTAGDIIYRNATVPVRLGIGTAGQVLTVNSGATAPEWSTPASGATYVGANVYNTTSLTIATNTDTIVTFNSERNDTNAFHSTSTNTGRLTIPTGYSGKYQIRCQLTWFSGALANLYMGIRKNGTVFYTQPAFSLQQQFSLNEDLVAGDYLEITVFQNTGSNGFINENGGAGNQSRNEFSVIYLGA